MNTGLIVLDMQVGLFKQDYEIYNNEKLLEVINSLINKFQQRNLPVIYIRHTDDNFLIENSDDWQMHPNINITKKALIFNKHVSSFFKQKKIAKRIKKLNIESLVITGLVSHGCVKAACLDGNASGYDIILVEDGHSNFDKNADEIVNKINLMVASKGIKVIPAEDLEI